jgi:hypothetical protein
MTLVQEQMDAVTSKMENVSALSDLDMILRRPEEGLADLSCRAVCSYRRSC